jgi:hypothetical protein
MTRRGATRRQWKQISQLRPQGALGHPAENCRSQSYVRATPVIEEIGDFHSTDWRPDTTPFQPYEPAEAQPSGGRSTPAALGAVAALAIGLFLRAPIQDFPVTCTRRTTAWRGSAWSGRPDVWPLPARALPYAPPSPSAITAAVFWASPPSSLLRSTAYC